MRVRESLALVVTFCLIGFSTPGSSSNSLGIIVTAERAHLGDAAASPGSSVFGGDRVSTGEKGSLQVRTGAARFYLAAMSSATLTSDGGVTVATLNAGTAIFSTSTANGIELLAATAHIRPQSDGLTVAQVTLAGPKELVVSSRRGALAITVEDETQIIPEATSYRVLLEPPPASPEPQGPRGARTKGSGGGLPRKAAQNKFLLVATVVTGAVTIWAVLEALESPDRP